MSISKKRMLNFLIFFGVFLAMLIAVIAYYFVGNKAPIIQGTVKHHIPYKEDRLLDVYLPTQTVYDKHPVIIYFHGGAWVTGRKEAINFNRFNGAINVLRANGYCVISPEYTLAREGQSPFPDCIIDAFDAIRWVENHASEYQFDLSNVGVFGESAGAHIAMMMAFVQPEMFDLVPHSIQFQYLVDVYGPADMDMLYHGPTLDTLGKYLNRLPASLQTHLDLSRRLFGFNPIEDTVKANDFMKRYSPVSYLNPSAPPTLLIHGNADRIVPFEQSVALKAKLDELVIENELHVLEGVDHGFIKANAGQKKLIQTWLIDFVKKHYSE